MTEESRFVNANENAIEFFRDSKWATVTLSKPRLINRVLKLAEQKPDDVRILATPDTNGGYLYARVPVRWIKISPPTEKNLTDEQREELRERMKSVRDARDVGKIPS